MIPCNTCTKGICVTLMLKYFKFDTVWYDVQVEIPFVFERKTHYDVSTNHHPFSLFRFPFLERFLFYFFLMNLGRHLFRSENVIKV